MTEKTVKIESKEKLAKLLAMEDIDIQHRQVNTAMFDVKNRQLILPIWKDVNNDLYDLLVGHEVGHALFTPTNEKQLKDLIKKSSKHCVNVVEDARIESLMKRKYPGLVKSFYKGYQNLVEKDFFGLSEMDFDNIYLLDKLNLHFKVPSAVEGIVEFNKVGQSFVDRIEKIKKFDELEKICVDISNYIKENRTEEDQEESKYFDKDSESYSELDENQDFTYEDSENGPDADTDEEMEQGSSDEENEDSEETETDEDSEEANEASNEGESREQETLGNADPDHMPEFDDTPDDLCAKTIENFERKLEEITDKKSVNEYLTLPKDIKDNNINDYKDAWKPFKKYYDLESYREVASHGNDTLRRTYDWGFGTENEFTAQSERIFKDAKGVLDKIKRESTKNVAHMAMEFERKKTADIYKRVSFAKTGVLDTNKMFSAKYNDDIFKKNMRMPEGKNHGLCMFVDWSGSMAGNMAGCVKQLIELMFFCKKVNIPFEVYSFTDISADSGTKKNSFGYRYGDLVCDKRVTLNNYFSSRMNTRDFNEALLNMCVITNSFRGGYQCYPIPNEDRLGYTPLNGAIIASEKIIRDFKARNNIQKVHAVWITDGEGNNQYEKYVIDENGIPKYNHISSYNSNVYIQDEITKKNHQVNGRYLTPHLFQIIKDRLGCNIVGFYLDNQFGKKFGMMKYYYQANKGPGETMNSNNWVQKCKKDGYVVLYKGGYDEYYVISDAPKVIKTGDIEEKMTARRMATIFSAKSTQFKNSRVILSRFIDLITV